MKHYQIDSRGKFVFKYGTLEPLFNFGKHKGKSVVWVLGEHPSYIEWLLRSGFDEDTKVLVRSMKYSFEMGSQ